MDMRKPRRSLVVTAFVLLATTACARAPSSAADAVAEPAGDAGAPIATSEVPSIRATLWLEQLSRGKRSAQETYRSSLARCEEAGWPVKPLSADQIERLDTGKVEVLFDATHRLVRQTSWEWRLPENSGRACPFEFKERTSELYVDAKVTGHSGDEAEPGWQESPTEEGALDVYPVDADDRQKQEGWQAAGVAQEGAHPCKRWRNQAEDACVWSGGTRWGFEDGPANLASCFGPSPERFLTQLPLRVISLDGNGCQVRVESLSVIKGKLPASDVVPVTR